MQFPQFMEWAFLAIVTGGVTAICYILWKMYLTMSDLNAKMAVILERTNRHDIDIDKHDERIRHLETKT